MDSFAFFFSPLGREASGAEFGLSEREGERRHEDLWPELRRVSRIFLASLARLEREGAVWFGLVWIGGCLYLYAALPSLRICLKFRAPFRR